MKYARLLSLVAALLVWAPTVAAAQDDTDMQAAARAFQQGQRAQLRGEHARAAELFELADSLAPSAQALRSAIRNHRAAGNDAWAATLALLAFRRPGIDATSRQLAEETLAELEPTLARVIVECEPECSLVIDERSITTQDRSVQEVFTDPGPHELVVVWGDRRSDAQGIDLAPGEQQRFELEAPAEEVVVEEVEAEASDDSEVAFGPRPTLRDDAGGGLPPALFFIGLGVSAAVAGVYVWSLLDTLSLRDDYEADPTKARYDEGVGAQSRTIVLGSVAAGLAAASLVIGIFFTQWSSGGDTAEARTRPGLWLTGDGAGLSLAGRFGGGS